MELIGVHDPPQPGWGHCGYVSWLVGLLLQGRGACCLATRKVKTVEGKAQEEPEAELCLWTELVAGVMTHVDDLSSVTQLISSHFKGERGFVKRGNKLES